MRDGPTPSVRAASGSMKALPVVLPLWRRDDDRSSLWRDFARDGLFPIYREAHVTACFAVVGVLPRGDPPRSEGSTLGLLAGERAATV